MSNLIDDKRINQIITFLKSLNIESKRFNEKIDLKDPIVIQNFHEALTHSSVNKNVNYEKLEFFGDAVLRLAASKFIEKQYTDMGVGNRSKLRSQIVSDEWLTKLGKKIELEELIIKGPKAIGDNNSRDTIIAEATEALIGALYNCFNSVAEVNLWLDYEWEKDSEVFLKAPYKFNAKSALQEWCQGNEIDLPKYSINEISKINGDPKRFLCKIYINGSLKSSSYGRSHKKAEKNAASKLIEEFINEGKF